MKNCSGVKNFVASLVLLRKLWLITILKMSMKVNVQSTCIMNTRFKLQLLSNVWIILRSLKIALFDAHLVPLNIVLISWLITTVSHMKEMASVPLFIILSVDGTKLFKMITNSRSFWLCKIILLLIFAWLQVFLMRSIMASLCLKIFMVFLVQDSFSKCQSIT